MSILVVGAHKLELEAFRNHFSSIRRLDCGHGVLELLQGGTKTVYLLKTGIGLENAERSLKHALGFLKDRSEHQLPDTVLNFGLCGAIHPERTIGDLVIGENVISEDQVNTIFNFESGIISDLSAYLESKNVEFFTGKIYSSNKAISDETTRTKIHQDFDAQVVDMESAAYAQVCQRFDIPCAALKYVSDNADEFVMKDFLAYFEEASDILGEIIYGYTEQRTGYR